METQTATQSEVLYAALVARDARFDGRFFVGVTSTGVYCRPVCRVRAPRRENCLFFIHAAAAEKDGFRPCLRCRPELAPGTSAMEATARLAQCAARLIGAGLDDDATLEDLARRLGTSDRHLRRTFIAHFGVTPIAYAQSQRLLQAKRLLQDTHLPVTEVAFAAGFRSVRRFNALLKERYGLSPRDIRGKHTAPHSLQNALSDTFTVQMAYRAPFDWQGLLTFLSGRTVAGVDRVDDDSYVRAVRLKGATGEVEGHLRVRNDSVRNSLHVTLSSSLSHHVEFVLQCVARQFDLACDPCEVARVLGPLARGREGLRVPSAFDPFEASVRAIVGQQVSVKGAATIAGRIATTFGPPLVTPYDGIDRLFPTPATLAALDPSAIAALGMPLARARTIVTLAQAVQTGHIDLENPVDVDATVAKLLALPGIGPWTAHYLSMRALGWPDAFPAGDLGVRKAYALIDPALGMKAREKDIEAYAERWRPWRSYATLHLWASLESAPAPLPNARKKKEIRK